MRLVVIGQADFGESVLKSLLGRGEEVVAVFYEREDDPLEKLAQEQGIPAYATQNLRDSAFFEETYSRFRPDLNLMAFVNVLIPRHVLDYPTHGTIQYHPSLLPFHRGRSAINWTIIFGEPRTGLTIFWPDEGLDTGPILLQKEVEIGPSDTLGSLYFNQLFPLGTQAMVEAVAAVRQGTAPVIPQDHLQATYEPPCEGDLARIQWFYPAQRVYDHIRGCDPRPGAFTVLGGEKVRLFNVEHRPRSGVGRPGEVLAIEDGSLVVALNGGELAIGRVKTSEGSKVKAAEFARSVGLKPGDRLGK
jgi:methionyl-tRNA formyltransferase